MSDRKMIYLCLAHMSEAGLEKKFIQEAFDTNWVVPMGSNVEALRVFMLEKKVDCHPVWKPMHKQPVYASAPAYVNGVSEAIFKVGFCLHAGPYVTDEDVRYIVDCIKEAIC